jgi:hypothetical protein
MRHYADSDLARAAGTVNQLTPLDCPFCAHGELAVIVLELDPVVFAVRCPECGGVGPRSTSDDPAHAVSAGISAWDGSPS